MHRGYIKLWRKIEDWDWFKCSDTLHLFLYMMMKANHKDGQWQGIEVKRGQLITGRNSLSEKTGLTIRSVRTSLERLKKTKEVTIKTTNKFSIVTLCNYDVYNNDDQQNDPLNGNERPANDQQTTSKRPQTRIKELKNKKNLNNNCHDYSPNNSGTIQSKLEIFVSEVNTFLEYHEDMRKNFIRYWTELNQSKTKMRFQMEKTFEISKRLATWKSRSNSTTFNKSQVQHQQTRITARDMYGDN